MKNKVKKNKEYIFSQFSNVKDIFKYITLLLFIIAINGCIPGFLYEFLDEKGPFDVEEELPYSEGGKSIEDPGQSEKSVRYIDPVNGDDNKNGESQDNAWQTWEKVVDSAPNLLAGTLFLFKRGTSCITHEIPITGAHGEEWERITIGAYGSLTDGLAQISKVSLEDCSYIMIRDIEAIQIKLSKGISDIVVYNNTVHGAGNNGIAVLGGCTKVAVIGNLIYDIQTNDYITIHTLNWETPSIELGDHFWVTDNVVIGNGDPEPGGSAPEEGIDVAPDDDPENGLPKDFKIINNRIQCKSINGFSSWPGQLKKAISLGHQPGGYYWVLGNTLCGATDRGIEIGSSSEDLNFPNVKMAGNIIYGAPSGKADAFLSGQKLECKNNTFIRSVTDGNSLVVFNFAKQHQYLHNMIISEKLFVQVRLSPESLSIDSMDYNWYGHLSEPKIDAKSFTDWQSLTGFDLNSGKGEVLGISAPSSDWDDPRDWLENSFKDFFIPDPSWEGDNQNIGAYNSNGERLGLAIEPFEDLELNQGYGWEGPVLIQLKYPIGGNNFPGNSNRF